MILELEKIFLKKYYRSLIKIRKLKKFSTNSGSQKKFVTISETGKNDKLKIIFNQRRDFDLLDTPFFSKPLRSNNKPLQFSNFEKSLKIFANL